MKMQNRNLIKWLILTAALLSPLGLQAQTFLSGDWTSSTVTVGVDTNGTLIATAPLNSSFTFNSTETSITNPQFLWVPALSALRAGTFYNAPSTTTMGQYSVALGNGTSASGQYSFASGLYSTASGYNSTVLGSGYASGSGALAVSYGSSATGSFAEALGLFTTATGANSMATGHNTLASGSNSTAMGYSTTAASYCSTALGQYNVGSSTSATAWVATDPLFEVGNGTSTTTSDALLLDKSGNLKVTSVTVTMAGGDIPMYTGN